MSDPTLIVVKNYQADGQQFWSGRKWVADPSDAEELRYKDALRVNRSFLKQGENTNIIENYGLESERIAV